MNPYEGIRSLFFSLYNYNEFSPNYVYNMMIDNNLHVQDVFLLEQSNALGGWAVREASLTADSLLGVYNVLKLIPVTEAAARKVYEVSEDGVKAIQDDLERIKVTPKWRIVFTGKSDEMPKVVTDEDMNILPEDEWKITTSRKLA